MDFRSESVHICQLDHPFWQSKAHPGDAAQQDISIDIEIMLALIKYFYTSRNMKMYSDDNLSLAQAASTFAALGSEQRLAVLRCLVRAGAEGLPIGMLGERSGVTGSTLTHHMKILAQAGLVKQEKQGRSIICAAVAYDQVTNLSQFLLRECCANSPSGDHNHD